jgi:hypothetical protein
MPSASKPGFFNCQRSIRWKLAAAFIAVACFVAAFVGVAIAIHLQTPEHAAQLETGHVSKAYDGGPVCGIAGSADDDGG